MLEQWKIFTKLYTTKIESDTDEQDKKRKVTNIGCKNISFNEDGVWAAISQMQNGRSAGEDGIVTEMLQLDKVKPL